MQTNHLALYPWCEMTEMRSDPATYARWSALEHHAYWNARFDVATSVLGTFLCVGVFDRLNESIELLARRSAQVGIALASPANLPAVNGTARHDGDDGWLDRGTPLGERIVAALADDFKLYAYATALLDAALAEPAEARRAPAR